jgi:hypothetical protein
VFINTVIDVIFRQYLPYMQPHWWCNVRSGQIKDYEIGICCFSAKHATLKRKSKDWLAQSQDNVSEYGDMSI